MNILYLSKEMSNYHGASYQYEFKKELSKELNSDDVSSRFSGSESQNL